MKAYGVPWNTKLVLHPLHNILSKSKPKGIVSLLYSQFLLSSYTFLYKQNVWLKDLNQNDDSIQWDKVWGSVIESSKNPDHQQIQINYIHRAYLTLASG